ncbi:hypothetical protein H17ap60334_05349 [Thermosipho africanus H17ap60334]|nr:hypothetical protein H17ap60334_05349 [Thermosipho africanus H17ap60334]
MFSSEGAKYGFLTLSFTSSTNFSTLNISPSLINPPNSIIPNFFEMFKDIRKVFSIFSSFKRLKPRSYVELFFSVQGFIGDFVPERINSRSPVKLNSFE